MMLFFGVGILEDCNTMWSVPLLGCHSLECQIVKEACVLTFNKLSMNSVFIEFNDASKVGAIEDCCRKFGKL